MKAESVADASREVSKTSKPGLFFSATKGKENATSTGSEKKGNASQAIIFAKERE